MKTIAVVGAQGALGYAAALEAVGAHGVRAIVRHPRPNLFPADVDVVRADAADGGELTRAVEGCRALLFCVNVPIATWAQRLPALLGNAIEACRATGARLVFPGNVWIYGPGPSAPQRVDESRPPSPTSVKGKLRVALESQLSEAGIDHGIVRLPEFYGPNVVNTLMGAPFRAALRGRSIFWLGGRLDVVVEYIYIRDAARAMLEAAQAADASGAVFHVEGSGHTTPRKFWQEVLTAAQSSGRVYATPNWVLRGAGLASAEARAFADVLHLWTEPVLLDGSKYRARFGSPAPTPYATGIRESLHWFRQNA